MSREQIINLMRIAAANGDMLFYQNLEKKLENNFRN